jgi:UDP-3-O-[3-hydroxymyristoyl] N-acetylglucosamine deacetylase
MTDPEGDQPGAPTRRTPTASARVEGLGLFTGRRASVAIHPASGGDGIFFRRLDLPGKPLVTAAISNVVSEQRRTVLQADPAQGGARVETVEHILSALAGLGITDALIEVDGPEIPIADGSALPFTQALSAVGTTVLSGVAPAPIRVDRPLTVGERGGQIDVLPLDAGTPAGCEFVYRLDYGPASPVAAHEARFFLPLAGGATAYIRNVAPARTFSTLAEAQAMRSMGLFTQFTPRDLLVIGPDGPIDNTLRFPWEPAMHKLLDMVGDLSLCGRPVVGRIVATRSGHALNHELARALAALP